MKKNKEKIKDNPKEEDAFVGWFKIEPYKPTDFDYFLEKSVGHGLIDEKTKFILDYYNAEEKLSTPDQKT